jgi:LysM repeat protein
MGKARARMKLSANVTEEQDWYLDTPDVRLTRIFTVVILLHVIAVGGIFAFKMVDKASDASAVKISTAHRDFDSAVQEARETAAAVPVATPIVEAPARPPVPAPLRPDPAKLQHKVVPGDSLPEIARQYGVTPEALRAKNSIRSDNELYHGRYLDIPGQNEPVAVAQPVAATSATPAAPAAPATASTSQGSTYEVKPGDTPWAISRKFNIPFNTLMKENGISDAQSLQIGQKLRIPAAR